MTEKPSLRYEIDENSLAMHLRIEACIGYMK